MESGGVPLNEGNDVPIRKESKAARFQQQVGSAHKLMPERPGLNIAVSLSSCVNLGSTYLSIKWT
jgi:hypothetical protein